MAQGKAQPDGPHQNADVVSIQQGINRVRDHAHQQAAKHLDNAGWRGDITRGRGKVQRGREQEAKHHRRQGGRESTQQIEEQNRTNVGFLAVLVVGNGGHHQHQHQHRCDGF
ncbi:hypothetical protein D3C76_1256010 [compost metagenome]